MSIARAVLVGTLEQEPEKRFTPQNVAVTSFWISVPGKPLANGQASTPSRVKLTCWRGLAESAGHLQKGQVVMIEGKLMLPSYQDQSGVQRKHFEVEVNALSVLPGGLPESLAVVGSAQTATGGNLPQQAAQTYSAPAAAASFSADDDMYTVEDIPF